MVDYSLIAENLSTCNTLADCLLQKLEDETSDDDILNLTYLLSEIIKKCYNIIYGVDTK